MRGYNLEDGIWDYFDLGENIICVNAIGENIQQRLNGCDYDSDMMLITDDIIISGIIDLQYMLKNKQTMLKRRNLEMIC